MPLYTPGAPADAALFSVKTYGALGDGQYVTDGAMASGSTTFTSASASFTSADAGKAFMVKGGGASGVTTLVTTIQTVNSSTSVTLAAANASGGAISGKLALWATDDTASIQSAINAAITYANAHGSARVFLPPGSGRFYGVAGALVTGGSTLGNAQLTLGAPVATTANKAILTIEGETSGAGVQHWQQLNQQLGGSTIVSFGVFASSAAQTASINANGNPCVIGGPAQPGGYGVNPGVFSNMSVTLRNLSIVTTHSSSGLTYSAFDFSGIANAGLENFAYGTNGVVASNDYGSPSGFANGLSVGGLMPANGNNDLCMVNNVTCHGGYTYGFFATEHSVINRMAILYCWSAYCPVGTYFSSVGATHGMWANQLSIEGCTNEVYIIGTGSSGTGPFINIDQLDTETSSPTFADNNSGAGLAAALGTIRLTGLYAAASISASGPTGLKIIDGQKPYPVIKKAGNYTVTIADQTLMVDASSGAVTITLISAANTPNTYTVKKIDSSANTVTVATTGGQTIDGASTSVISSQWGKVTVAPFNGNWYTV